MSIAFFLGPRLNASGRLDTASLSYKLLTSPSLEEAQPLAERLEALNRDRQILTDRMLAQAREQVTTDPPRRLLFAADESFHPGVVGLVASRLVEEFYRPSVVVEFGKEESRGSARSIAEFDIGLALDECADLLDRHGGHPAAGGFTVRNENLPALRDRLLAIADRELSDIELVPTLNVDLEVALREIDWATQALVEQMEPCGQGNPRPLFLSRRARVREARAVGRENGHLRLQLADGLAVWNAIGFGLGRWAGNLGEWVDVVYTIEADEWRGERRLQLHLEDLRPSR